MHLSYSSDEGNRNLYAGKQQVKSHLLRINAASGPPLTFHSPTPACVPLVEARSVLLIDISSPSHDLPLLCEEWRSVTVLHTYNYPRNDTDNKHPIVLSNTEIYHTYYIYFILYYINSADTVHH